MRTATQACATGHSAAVQTPQNAEHIAFALWPQRRKFRNLHAGEFESEMSLLIAVRTDLSMRNFTTLAGALDFYRDLNQSF